MGKAIAAVVLLLVGFLAYRFMANLSDPVPLKNLELVHPVAPLAALSAKSDPDQHRLYFSQTFQFSPFYRLKPLATYRLEARVLSARDYSKERSAEAQISPVDFALGWGVMAEPRIARNIPISQDHRFYHFTSPGNPDVDTIAKHSANTHMVPINDEVYQQLMKVEKGDLIRLRGYLVKVVGDDGWTWKSSLTRSDTGGGACELMLVAEMSKEE